MAFVAGEDVVDDLLLGQAHEVVAFGAGGGEDFRAVVDAFFVECASAKGWYGGLDGLDLVEEVAVVGDGDDERVIGDPGVFAGDSGQGGVVALFDEFFGYFGEGGLGGVCHEFHELGVGGVGANPGESLAPGAFWSVVAAY